MNARLLRARLTPEGFLAFVSCARMQRRHIAKSWPDAIYTAWVYGPTRRGPRDV